MTTRLTLSAGVLALCLSSAPASSLLADDLLPPPSLSDSPNPVELARLVSQLDHGSYDVRSNAELQLLFQGEQAIDALLQAQDTLRTEGAFRSARILEHFFISSDLALADAADEALQELEDLGGPAGEQASNVLQRHAALREERTIARIRALGGDVRPYTDTFKEEIAVNLLPADAIDEVYLRPQTIWLYPEWSGGVEGLKLLRRFSHLEGMDVYQIRGNELSLFDVQMLAAELPGATIVERGPACLGIKCGAFEPCVIQETTRGGAAEKGGLMTGDTIRAIDNIPVRSFNDLIDQLSLYDPGDVVTLSVQSGYREPQPIEVTLSHWREINEAADPSREEGP